MAYYAVVATLMKVKDVCDVCGNKRRKTKRYRVAQDGDLVQVDLCAEDGKYLDKLIKMGERLPNPRPRPLVWSMEAIEAERKKQERKNRP